jgi:glutaredoxin 1
MFAVIFGRPGCPYCACAKALAEKLTEERDDFNFRYVDIHAEGISKADLEKETVPQIFLDQKHIGGCTDFEAYAKITWGYLPLSNTRTPSPEGRFYLSCLRRYSKLRTKRKHSAPSAHQNTPLSNHASSCQRLLDGTYIRRISSRHNGAASIAPNKGLTTSPL